MQSMNTAVVRGKDGWGGTVRLPASPTHSDPTHVRVQLESGEHYRVPAAVVLPQRDGSVYVPWRVAELGPAPRKEPAETLYAVGPVLAEEVEGETHVVETGKVRLTKVVHEREVPVDEPLWREEVEVTRVPIQRVADGPGPGREDNGMTRLSVVEEVLVIEQRWRLREESHSRTQRIETH